MLLRLRSAYFRFVYTFESGHKLVGFVAGERFSSSPDRVFNLRSLKAIGLNPQGDFMMGFDTVFGQFSTASPDVLFTGTHTNHESFFSFNYRGAEASIYDAATDTWVASGWNPNNWTLEELSPPSKSCRSIQSPPVWATKAIA